MSQVESALWALIKRNITQPHWARIESWNKQGISDVNGCYMGREFWVELKVCKHQKIEFKKYQPAWILNRTKAGGIVWICVRKADTIRLYWGGRVKEVVDNGWRVEPDFEWNKPWPWARIFEVLMEHPPLEMSRV